ETILPRVDPAARLGDALEARDDPFAIPAELEIDDQGIEGFALLDVIVPDVALLLGRRAISTFMREVGMTALSWSALLAFRMRVSMSAIGSVSIASPARFRHAGNRALMGEVAQADAAEAELAE